VCNLRILYFSVRQDLIWGVNSLFETDYHIVQSHYLSQIYRVGVLTANFAYVIRPSFFDSHIYLDFNQAPRDVRRVDDIWLNGHAAKRNIARYVVPSCCPHIGVTQTHVLQTYFGRNNMSRLSANSHALQWFGKDWEKDLWYKYNGGNKPEYRDVWTIIRREWISTIEWIEFVIYFGFVYI
jgi:hypothetical protein